MDGAKQVETLHKQLKDAEAEASAQKERADRLELELRNTRYRVWLQERRALAKDCMNCRAVSQKTAGDL